VFGVIRYGVAKNYWRRGEIPVDVIDPRYTGGSGIIVSVWGRGSWLARELKKSGLDITLLDIPLPLSSVEREGPFGIFLPNDLTDSQVDHLCTDNYYSIDQGFSIFSDQGPVEFQGPLVSFYKESRKDFSNGYFILSNHLDMGLLKKRNKNFNKKEGMSLLKLSAKWSASYKIGDDLIVKYVKNNNIKNNFVPFFSPLFSDYILRESSNKYFDSLNMSLKKEDNCKHSYSTSIASVNTKRIKLDRLSLEKQVGFKDQKEGEKVIFPNKIIDSLELNKKTVSIGYRGNKKKQYSFLVWSLSGPETKRYFPEWMPLLFPKWQEPIKTWKRFSLSWDQEDFYKVVPYILLVQYRADDFFILKKNPTSSLMDLWVLCPYVDRFDRSKLLIIAKDIMAYMRILFPYFTLDLKLPMEDNVHDYFVVYENKKTMDKMLKKTSPLLYHLNPEVMGKLDAYSLMKQSEWVFNKLVK